jgi:hypothetical protein
MTRQQACIDQWCVQRERYLNEEDQSSETSGHHQVGTAQPTVQPAMIPQPTPGRKIRAIHEPNHNSSIGTSSNTRQH